MSPEQLNERGYGLPLEQTICFSFVEKEQASVTVTKAENGKTTMFVRKRSTELYKRIEFPFKADEEIVQVVAPHGVSWIACLISTKGEKGWSMSCRIVDLAGAEIQSMNKALGSDLHTMSWLLGAAEKAGCFLAVVYSFRPDRLDETKRCYVDYSVAQVGLLASDFKILCEYVGPRFRY
jgi:hypothetical protein